MTYVHLCFSESAKTHPAGNPEQDEQRVDVVTIVPKFEQPIKGELAKTDIHTL